MEEEKLTTVLALVSPDQLKPLGHQFKDMVLSCTYRGAPCRYVWFGTNEIVVIYLRL